MQHGNPLSRAPIERKHAFPSVKSSLLVTRSVEGMDVKGGHVDSVFGWSADRVQAKSGMYSLQAEAIGWVYGASGRLASKRKGSGLQYIARVTSLLAH